MKDEPKGSHEGGDERIEKRRIVQLSSGAKEEVEDVVVIEAPLSIFLNGEKFVTLLCTPQNQESLAVGFLFSEGLIEKKEEIKNISFDREKNEINISTVSNRSISPDFSQGRILTSGCAKGVTYSNIAAVDPIKDLLIDLRLTLTSSEIQKLMHQFEKSSLLFRQTGGVHGAALADRERILIFFEDIGRHNAVDKVFGRCLLDQLPCEDKVLLLSGRISSDILAKTSRSGIGIIISRSAPTSLAVKNAQKLGITLVGFARGSKMNIYSFPLRITI